MELFIENDLNIEDFTRIKPFGTQIRFKKNQVVINQGQYVDSLFFIYTGFAKLCLLAEDGRSHIVGYCGSMSFISEFFYLSGGRESNYSVTAATDVFCCVFDKFSLRNLFNQYDIAFSIGQSAIKKCIMAENKIKNICFLSAEKRIILVIKGFMDKFGVSTNEGILIDFYISRKDLADLSGCSIEMVDLFLKNSKKNNVILRLKDRLLITNAKELWEGGII